MPEFNYIVYEEHINEKTRHRLAGFILHMDAVQYRDAVANEFVKFDNNPWIYVIEETRGER